MNNLLHKTIRTRDSLVSPNLKDAPERAITFWGVNQAKLRTTRCGNLWLSLALTCGLSGAGEMEVRQYSYRIGENGVEDAVFRWDYTKRPDPRDAEKCRHHIQGKIPVTLGTLTCNLDDLHAPTGYVSIEEIIRFCIDDLGAPHEDGWHGVVKASETEFASRQPWNAQ